MTADWRMHSGARRAPLQNEENGDRLLAASGETAARFVLPNCPNLTKGVSRAELRAPLDAFRHRERSTESGEGAAPDSIAANSFTRPPRRTFAEIHEDTFRSVQIDSAAQETRDRPDPRRRGPDQAAVRSARQLALQKTSAPDAKGTGRNDQASVSDCRV